ncbi:hypothetical protein BIT28_25670 [Photobacterium proteolyticum]|uniref:Uncharacterized protein n=1 Tax=Photobacterium proteolyticum TaxID=1903952 RepID=A0A1Q9GFV6_9GAMM|nr:hypothetical protein BIT28_25670 [Photobacterium proteolyticum]
MFFNRRQNGDNLAISGFEESIQQTEFVNLQAGSQRIFDGARDRQSASKKKASRCRLAKTHILLFERVG